MKIRSRADIALLSLVVMFLTPALADIDCAAATPQIDTISPTSHAAGAFPVILSGRNFSSANVMNILVAGNQADGFTPTRCGE